MKIIVNADDFGKSVEINRAINDSYKRGFVNSIGIIINAECVQNAVNQIDNGGGYWEDVHIHFNLSSNAIPLTTTISKDPYFCKNGLFKLFAYTPNRNIPSGCKQLFKWKMVYNELEAQYHRFLEMSHGRGDGSHIDFHVWYNLSLPVAIALHHFIKNYNIKSARLIGFHQMDVPRYRLFSRISSNPNLRCYQSTNMDYYLSHPEKFKNEEIVELYCHPEYKDNVLLDNSLSYLRHERQPLQTFVEKLRLMGNVEFISWKEIN